MLKKYARRGQCFSTAKYITDIDRSRLEVIEDVKRNGFTFTDGCGSISESLAALISEKFKLPISSSAFQIRLGGAKGVLMVKPDNEMTRLTIEDYEVVETPVDIRLRESQVKFASSDLSLNVVRCATFSQGYLNRQIIILLNSLGVPDQVFLDLQREAKQRISIAEIYKNLVQKTQRIQRGFTKLGVHYNNGAKLANLINFSIGPSKWFQEIIKVALLQGYEIQRDPIMSSLLYTTHLSQTIALKKKAKIFVRDSCVLLGVVDDQAILAPNEVFIQIHQPSQAASQAHL